MFEAFKKKTVEDIVETAKDTVTEVVNTGMEEKVKGLVMLVPLLFTGILIFSGNGRHNDDAPAKQVIINNYYYGDKKGGMRHVGNHHCEGGN